MSISSTASKTDSWQVWVEVNGSCVASHFIGAYSAWNAEFDGTESCRAWAVLLQAPRTRSLLTRICVCRQSGKVHDRAAAEVWSEAVCSTGHRCRIQPCTEVQWVSSVEWPETRQKSRAEYGRSRCLHFKVHLNLSNVQSWAGVQVVAFVRRESSAATSFNISRSVALVARFRLPNVWISSPSSVRLGHGKACRVLSPGARDIFC